MMMAPVSLIFLSVPESSSALACPAQTAAASARPFIRRRFIGSLLKMSAQGLHALARTGGIAGRDRTDPALERLGGSRGRNDVGPQVGGGVGFGEVLDVGGA